MTIRELEQDPRSPEQKQADEKVLDAVERGEFPTVSSETRQKAMARLREKREAREQAAEVGRGLGQLRRDLGVTQEQLAAAIGSQKSNVSRLESGRYGGLSLETFLSVYGALQELSGIEPSALWKQVPRQISPSISHEELRRFGSPQNCLETIGAA